MSKSRGGRIPLSLSMQSDSPPASSLIGPWKLEGARSARGRLRGSAAHTCRGGLRERNRSQPPRPAEPVRTRSRLHCRRCHEGGGARGAPQQSRPCPPCLLAPTPLPLMLGGRWSPRVDRSLSKEIMQIDEDGGGDYRPGWLKRVVHWVLESLPSTPAGRRDAMAQLESGRLRDARPLVREQHDE
jgi:hypothetical protein